MALIDRGRVMIDYLENLGRKDSYKAKYEALSKAVDQAPAVGVAPEEHAEWDHWGSDEWQCTNCAEFVHTEGSWERPWQKYCPYCGAKMDKEADE